MTDYQGKLIEYLDGAGVRFGVVTRQAGDKLQVTDERGRHERISLNYVILVHSSEQLAGELDAVISRLKSQVEEVKAEIDTEFLWESTVDEPREYELVELTCSYFGHSDAIHQSALFRALMDDTLHFKRHGIRFTPRARQHVADQIIAMRRRGEKEAFRQQALQWIRAVLTTDGDCDVPPAMVGLLQQTEDFLLRQKTNEATTLLRQAHDDLTAKEAAFELLIKTGRLDTQADPLLVIAGIEERFPRRVLEQAEQLAPFQPNAARRDFTALITFSIDDEETREVDDALTIQHLGDRWRVGIHIADVAHFVGKDVPLDQEAYRRSVSIYLPTRTVTMFPERLSYDLASLNQDAWRPTMSFEVDFDTDARILDWRVSRGQIRVTHRLSYAQVDQMLQMAANDPVTEQIHHLATLTPKLLNQRVAAGATIIRRPQLKIHVKDDQITVKVLDPNSPSRQLISEMMILANRLAAQYAVREGIPLIYRTQDASEGEPGYYGAESGYDPVSVMKALKGMRRSRLSLSPQPHAGLGLDAYTQLTSPIRRFSDVVIQRQIAAALAGEPLPYEKEELLHVLGAAESAERDMRAIERQAVTYWVLEYLARQPADSRHHGWIIEQTNGGYVVELDGLFIHGFLSTKARHAPGDYIMLCIEHVDPKKSVLRLRETD